MRHIFKIYFLCWVAVCAESCSYQSNSVEDATAPDVEQMVDGSAPGDVIESRDTATREDGSNYQDSSATPDSAVARDASQRRDANEDPDATTTSDPLCLLPPESGNCQAYFEHYAYNSTTGACEKFVYGGCGGNANNFETAVACLQACVSGYDGSAACKVGESVYPSGMGNIDDPFSCNRCTCANGRLGCTKMSCPEDCPPNGLPGESCAACGPADECRVVEFRCLPVCSDDDHCQGSGYYSCTDGLCKNVCG